MPLRPIPYRRQPVRAFTLIELLVVIAILSILAAVLFPVFARARNSAQRASCQSNLKQLAAAFDLYLDSWDDQYPNSWQDRSSPYGEMNHSWWDEQISPYVKDDRVFACPSNETASYSVHQRFDSRGLKTRVVNYALNNQLLHCPPGAFRFAYEGDPPDPALRNEVESPSETILLAEKMLDEPDHLANPADATGNQSEEIDVWYQLTGPGLDPASWNPTWGVARALHDKGSDFLFADGHVKYLRLQDTIAAAPPAPASPSPSPPGASANGSSGGAQSPTVAAQASGAGGIDPILWKLTKH